MENQFGAIVADARRRKGITLAQILGCTKSWASNIETGKKFPSARRLKIICEALDLDVLEMIGIIVKQKTDIYAKKYDGTVEQYLKRASIDAEKNGA